MATVFDRATDREANGSCEALSRRGEPCCANRAGRLRFLLRSPFRRRSERPHTEAELLAASRSPRSEASTSTSHREEFRAWMRSQPGIARSADSEILEPLPFIDRWTAIGLIRVGLTAPVSGDELDV